MGMKALLQQLIDGMSPWQMFAALVVFGLLTGGGGQMMVGRVFNYHELNATLDRLNESMVTNNTAIQTQTELLRITRCEILADRNGTDWRNCWVPVETIR